MAGLHYLNPSTEYPPPPEHYFEALTGEACIGFTHCASSFRNF
jgi:hypothetical protein